MDFFELAKDICLGRCQLCGRRWGVNEAGLCPPCADPVGELCRAVMELYPEAVVVEFDSGVTLLDLSKTQFPKRGSE